MVNGLMSTVLPVFLAHSSLSAGGEHYPEFSWDTVPLYVHFGKTPGLLTEEEAEFVARRSSFVCLEKSHGLGELGTTEKGIAADAARLKALNPKMKVLFYWNSFIHYPQYGVYEELGRHPDWLMRDRETGELVLKSGRIRQYNVLDPDFQTWWASVAGDAVHKYECDGIFMDAVDQTKRAIWMQRSWGIGNEEALTDAMISMMEAARQSMGDNGIILYNGLRSLDGTPGTRGSEYLAHADGANVEHFGAFRSRTKESMLADIEAMQAAGEQGKIVAFKGWPDPDFTWTNSEKMRASEDELHEEAKAKITFPLACFLAGAREHSYFCYSWGYREGHGSLLDYREFDRPLGPPAGPGKREGWVLTREFERASVWVDLESRRARIEWR